MQQFIHVCTLICLCSCADFYTLKSPDIDTSSYPQNKPFLGRTCIQSVLISNKGIDSPPMETWFSCNPNKVISEELSKTNLFEIITQVDKPMPNDCDHTVTFIFEFGGYRKQWEFWLQGLSAMTLTIIPFWSEVTLRAEVQITKRGVITKKFHFAEKYKYWQSIFLLPFLFMDQRRYDINSEAMIRHLAKNTIKQIIE